MTIVGKIKRRLSHRIARSKRWLIPDILKRLLLSSDETRHEPFVERRPSKYTRHQGNAERARRITQHDRFVPPVGYDRAEGRTV